MVEIIDLTKDDNIAAAEEIVKEEVVEVKEEVVEVSLHFV